MSLREQLQALYDQHGRLTPGLVVEVARDKRHPLHSVVFDKDVKDAAEAYYLIRARELIRSCRIRYSTPEGGIRDTRAFLATRGDDAAERVYRPAEEVATDPLLREMMLRDMRREWRQMYERYSRFQEFVVMVNQDLNGGGEPGGGDGGDGSGGGLPLEEDLPEAA